jgi:antitoxin component YwqK of YwqJK toxin-antitoxin module
MVLHIRGIEVDESKLSKTSLLFTDLIEMYGNAESLNVPDEYDEVVVNNYISWINNDNVVPTDWCIDKDNIMSHLLFAFYMQDNRFIVSLTGHLLMYGWDQCKLLIKQLSSSVKNLIYEQIPYLLVVELESLQYVNKKLIKRWIDNYKSYSERDVSLQVGNDEYIISYDDMYQYRNQNYGHCLFITINGQRNNLLIGSYHNRFHIINNMSYIIDTYIIDTKPDYKYLKYWSDTPVHISIPITVVNSNIQGTVNNNMQGTVNNNMVINTVHPYNQGFKFVNSHMTENRYDEKTKLSTITYYKSDGEPIMTTTRSCDSMSLYYPNGDNPSSYNSGITVYYYDNNNKMLQTNYVCGNKHGVETVWYDNTVMMSITNYQQGIKHGLSQYWDNKGRLTFNANYYQNKLHGQTTLTQYDKNITYINNYRYGVLDGLQKQICADTGTIVNQINYVSGHNHGLEQHYDQDKLTLEIYYRHDVILRRTEF